MRNSYSLGEKNICLSIFQQAHAQDADYLVWCSLLCGTGPLHFSGLLVVGSVWYFKHGM